MQHYSIFRIETPNTYDINTLKLPPEDMPSFLFSRLPHDTLEKSSNYISTLKRIVILTILISSLEVMPEHTSIGIIDLVTHEECYCLT